jgi:hypothetical protein
MARFDGIGAEGMGPMTGGGRERGAMRRPATISHASLAPAQHEVAMRLPPAAPGEGRPCWGMGRSIGGHDRRAWG